MYVGLILLLRSQVRRFHPSLWRDGRLIALGAGAFGALSVIRVTKHSSGEFAAILVNAAYPTGDILLSLEATGTR